MAFERTDFVLLNSPNLHSWFLRVDRRLENSPPSPEWLDEADPLLDPPIKLFSKHLGGRVVSRRNGAGRTDGISGVIS